MKRVLVLGFALTLSAADSPASPRPNIVVITTDDLNLSTLDAAIAEGWMPNLKASIIDQGLTFTDSFVVDSVCCPSRATFLTGQHTHNHGVLSNDHGNGGGVIAFDDSSALPIWLTTAGYRTGFVGKYLNGYGQDIYPSPTDDPTYIPPGWAEWNALLGLQMYDYTLNDNGTIVTYGSQPSDYGTDVLAARAADFIEESDAINDAQPFFLWVTPGAPHALKGTMCGLNYKHAGPYMAAQRHQGIAQNIALPRGPSFNEGNVSDKPAWLRSNYPLLTNAQVNCLAKVHRGRVEEMMAVDDLVGTVVGELQARGELSDTVLVFTSDNGYMMGEHRLSMKQQAYEEAIRVPLYMKGPGIVGPATAHQMVLNMDLAPTILELAQASAGLVEDGRSLVPVLQDPGFGPWRSHFLIEHKKTPDSPVVDYTAVRSTRYLWVEYADGQRELYDLVADPQQLTSQHGSDDYAPAKKALRQVLNTLRPCTGSGCWQ